MQNPDSPALLERPAPLGTAAASEAVRRAIQLLAACTMAPATATELLREDGTGTEAGSTAGASFRTPDGWRLRVTGTRFDAVDTELPNDRGRGQGRGRPGRAGLAAQTLAGGARITLSRLDGAPFSAPGFNPARLLARCGAAELLVGYTRSDRVDVLRTFSIDDHGEACALSEAVHVSRLWFIEPTLAATPAGAAHGSGTARGSADSAAEDTAMALVMAALAGLAAARRATVAG